MSTGVVLHNESKSVGHAYFSATVDSNSGTVWVFGSAVKIICHI